MIKSTDKIATSREITGTTMLFILAIVLIILVFLNALGDYLDINLNILGVIQGYFYGSGV